MHHHDGTKTLDRYRTTVLITALLIGCFIPTLIQSTQWYAQVTDQWLYELRVLVKPAMRITTIVLCVWFFFGVGPKEQPKVLGIQTSWRTFFIGIGLGVLLSAPLLIVGMLGGVVEHPELRTLPFNSLGPGLFEELFFRAFAFGFLVRFAHWRIWPAAILTGIVFGLAHLQVSFVHDMEISSQAGWIAMLAGAGSFYAWLYARWGFNLWLVITMHTIMDLCSELFRMDQSPMGMAGYIGAIVLVFTIPLFITLRRTESGEVCVQ